MATHKDEHDILSTPRLLSLGDEVVSAINSNPELDLPSQNRLHRRLRRIKLSTSSLWFSALLLMVLGANTYFMFAVNQAYGNLITTQEHQRKSAALTNGLRLETAQLMQFVRAYTLTGESRYLLYYYDIVAIRMGKKAAPENYDPDVYWDNVVTERVAHKPLSENGGISLEMRMKALGFTSQELAAFENVLTAVASVTKIEQVAFAATQGLYDPVKGDFVSDGKPHLEFAAKLVNSNDYNQKQADLASAIKAMTVMVERRTEAEISVARALLQRQIHVSLGMLLGTFLLTVSAYELIRRQVLRPLSGLTATADRLASGDYTSRTSTRDGVVELITLGKTLNLMAQSVENDIEHRRQTQEELEKARSLAEDATRAKSMFLANMSHEIRTPMNAIIGMTYLALKTSLTQRQRDYIGQVERAARSLLGIINDILDFSKIEAGKLVLDQAPFFLEEIVGDSLSLLRHRAQEKEIELLLGAVHIYGTVFTSCLLDTRHGSPNAHR